MSVTIADILNADDDFSNLKKDNESFKSEVNIGDFNLEEILNLDKYKPIADEALNRYKSVSNGEDIGVAVIPILVESEEDGRYVFMVEIEKLQPVGMIVFPFNEMTTILETMQRVGSTDEA